MVYAYMDNLDRGIARLTVFFEHRVKSYKYQDYKEVINQLGSRILSRIVFDKDFFYEKGNENINDEAIRNDIMGVFNQIIFQIPNKKC